MTRNKHILIIRLSALGDVAMSIPAIYSAALAHPDSRMTVLTKPFFRRLFVNCPSNIDFILFDDKRHKGALGLLRLIWQLHKMHITHVADLHNVLRSWVIDASFILTFKKVRMLSKNRKERISLLKGKGDERRQMLRPFVLRYRDVFARLGIDAEPMITSLPANGQNPLPAYHGEKGGCSWVGVAPFARYTTKTYPLDQMQSVVSHLAEYPNVRVFLFGGKADQPVLKEWEAMSERIFCVAGTMPLEQELALMSRLDVMISMDSANQHMAALVGTKVLSIWGGTTPHCGFKAWQQSMETSLWADLPCQPCSIAGTPQCPNGNLMCMRQLSPAEVVTMTLNMLR